MLLYVVAFVYKLMCIGFALSCSIVAYKKDTKKHDQAQYDVIAHIAWYGIREQLRHGVSCMHTRKTWYRLIIEGSLEVKLPRIWTDEQNRWEESAEKRREEERTSKKRKSQKESEERRSRCAKRSESCETQQFSNDLWLRRVPK